MTDPANWADSSACDWSDRGLFFGAEGENAGTKASRERAAKAVCAQCPVWRPCLRVAVIAPVKFGVWGGTGEDERAELRRSYLRRMRAGVVSSDG